MVNSIRSDASLDVWGTKVTPISPEKRRATSWGGPGFNSMLVWVLSSHSQKGDCFSPSSTVRWQKEEKGSSLIKIGKAAEGEAKKMAGHKGQKIKGQSDRRGT